MEKNKKDYKEIFLTALAIFGLSVLAYGIYVINEKQKHIANGPSGQNNTELVEKSD